MLSVPTAVFAQRLLDRLEADAPTWLATLVGRDGHAYRAPGARLLIGAVDPGADAAPVPLAGRVSGGCVEEEIAARAREARGHAIRVRLDTADEGPFGLGLGCGGVLDVLIEPLGPHGRAGQGWQAWATALRDGRPALRWIDHRGTTAWATEATSVVLGAGAEVRYPDPTDDVPVRAGPDDVHARLHALEGGWLERSPAPPRLWVVGLDDDARAVARTMLMHGWRVTLAASSQARLQAAADDLATLTGRRPDVQSVDARTVSALPFTPEDRVLAASHRLDLDAAAVAAALQAGVRWVGGVASRARREALLRQEALGRLLVDDPTSLKRFEAPAGLNLAGRGAEEVAAAIVGRLVQDLRAAARSVAAIVPAAGAGSRLGGGKPLLSDGRETLLARAVRRAAVVSDEVIVVVGHDAERVAAAVPSFARVVYADAWRDGLSASLAAGLGSLRPRTRAMIVLPDMPGVRSAHLAALLTAQGRAQARAAGAVSRYADGRLGAPALLPDDLLHAARSDGASLRGDRGFASQWADRSDVIEVRLADDHDVDTPEQAARLGWTRASA